ncbi:MAG: prepilin-type N-terminal cleavage/methylation domain-containing protein [Syntrophales bacterium]|nr:prepilin-type N-terminal cleavage/methylation domain-containing protein [Syntrophales bacterium]
MNMIKKHAGCVKNSSGFTLVEMLIVIIILGILAMVVVPQFSVSQDDTKISTLKTNLSAMRSAIELYYQQHNNKYPGAVKTDGSGAATSDAEAKTAALDQLTLYSDAAGKTNASRTALTEPVFGPYLKHGIPTNPFNNKSDLVVDFDEASLSVARTGSDAGGYKYFPITGLLFSDDNLSSGGVAHATY